jgi:hypothetical protein
MAGLVADLVVPEIMFYTEPGMNADNTVNETLYGVEEEGVPCKREERTDISGAPALAFKAAGDSILGVGIGLDKNGVMAVQYKSLPADAPLFTVHYRDEPELVRPTASNAARLVKGIPFILPQAKLQAGVGR